MKLEMLRELAMPADTKILLLVIDGLGGLPNEAGRSELEQAHIPKLDRLAQESLCGLTIPVAVGVTPGSGPGHLALFGYDPEVHTVGRGVLEALGIDFDLQDNDVAARGNFCTIDDDGQITDRRAGRIETARSALLCRRLAEIKIPGVAALVEPVKDHRFLFVLRGAGLSDAVTDTDPQRVGAKPVDSRALDAASETTARYINEWVSKAREVLRNEHPANMLTLRGIARRPAIPSMPEACQFRAAAIAAYPMYRGLAKLVGMDVLKTGATFSDELETLKAYWNDYDFFFIHFKRADAAGEDGAFQEKIAALEEIDAFIDELHGLQADVFIIAGDHATPAIVAGHSWHPVPLLLHAKQFSQLDATQGFNEKSCAQGVLGTFAAKEVLSLAMAHAGRLAKYGA